MVIGSVVIGVMASKGYKIKAIRGAHAPDLRSKTVIVSEFFVRKIINKTRKIIDNTDIK